MLDSSRAYGRRPQLGLYTSWKQSQIQRPFDSWKLKKPIRRIRQIRKFRPNIEDLTI